MKNRSLWQDNELIVRDSVAIPEDMQARGL